MNPKAFMAVVCEENAALAEYILSKREEMMQKPKFSENLESTFTGAYTNVCDHKTPIITLREAAKVRGIGPWMLKQLKDWFSDGLEHPSQEDEAPRAKKSKSSRRYLPQKNSAPYALLITLHRGFLEGKKYMMKQELIDAAEISGLSRMPIQPPKGSSASGRFGDSTKDWYSGWSSMKTLVSKGLVVKSNCPAKYMLTDEGINTAEECVVRSGLANATTSAKQNSFASATPPEVSTTTSEPDERTSQKQKKGSTMSAAELRASSVCPPPTRPSGEVRSSSVCLPPTRASDNRSAQFFDTDKLALPPLLVGERFSDVYKVVLILDNRECFARNSKGIHSKPKFAERLREQYQVEVEIRLLPVGDAVWIAHHKLTKQDFVLDFIVERKAVDDLWSSIRDTRYKQQKLRLLRCGIGRLIYLIEGDPNLTEAAESLKTAALTTEILDGFDVQRTRDTHDTINRYGELTNAIFRRYSLEKFHSGNRRRCMSYEEFLEHCNDVEKERVRDVFGVQLMQVRHVTEDIALSILDNYPTVFSLAQAYTSMEGDASKQENLLTGLPIQNKNKTISSVISKNVYTFFWSQ